MNFKHLLDIRLNLFDGGGAAGGAGAGAAASGDGAPGTQGETQASSTGASGRPETWSSRWASISLSLIC